MFDPSVPARVVLPGDDERETTKGRAFLARVLTARQAPAVRNLIREVLEIEDGVKANEAAAKLLAGDLLVGWEWPGGPAFADCDVAGVLLDRLGEQQLWTLLGLARDAGVTLSEDAAKKFAAPSAAPASAT